MISFFHRTESLPGPDISKKFSRPRWNTLAKTQIDWRLQKSCSHAMPLSDLWDNHAAAEPLSELQQLQNRARTEKARIARAQKRSGGERVHAPNSDHSVEPHGPSDYALRLQTDFFTSSFHARSHNAKVPSTYGDGSKAFVDTKQKNSRERSRCVWSFLVALGKVVEQLFAPSTCAHHILNTCIADDTSTTLRGQGISGNTVHTIMNTVQTGYVRYDALGRDRWECLYIPTPIQSLNSAKAPSLHANFSDWLLVTATGLGAKWLKLGCQEFQSKWKTVVLIGDALKANDAAWKGEKFSLAKQHKTNHCRVLGLRVKCAVHQLALVRKPTVLSIEKYWSTLVRLGHLYETHSFRRSLGSAIMSVLQREGAFQRISCSTTLLRFERFVFFVMVIQKNFSHTKNGNRIRK